MYMPAPIGDVLSIIYESYKTNNESSANDIAPPDSFALQFFMLIFDIIIKEKVFIFNPPPYAAALLFSNIDPINVKFP